MVKTLLDILVEKNLLSLQQKEEITIEHLNTGVDVKEILVKRNLVNPRNMLEAEAVLFGIEFKPLHDIKISQELLKMIPEQSARKYSVIPLSDQNGYLHLGMVNPLDLQAIAFFEKKSGMRVRAYLCDPKELESILSENYSKSIGQDVERAMEDVRDPTVKKLDQEDTTIKDAPIARIVATALEYAVRNRASDIHIEPAETKTRVRYRIDGVLKEKLDLPKQVHESVISRIKIMSDLKIDEKRIPQDGRFKVEVDNRVVDLRVSTLPTVFGEKVVMRLLEAKGNEVISLSTLGIRGNPLKIVEDQISKTVGIILITGPTGSGKTNTLAAILTKLNTPEKNVSTLEDPVEIRIPGVNQVQVNPQAGLTFASGLRAFLRQDPNIIMVGEIRDFETAELATQAALTGHLVLSTLHTNSAAGALPRLLDMGVEPFLLASVINCIMAQRLVRKLCQNCKEAYEPHPSVVADLKAVLGQFFPQNIEKVVLYKPHGCEECGNIGYIGRSGIFEVLSTSDKVKKAVLERQPESVIQKAAVESGMVTLIQDGFLKSLEGITTIEEVLRVARI